MKCSNPKKAGSTTAKQLGKKGNRSSPEAVFAKVLPKIKPSAAESRKDFEAAAHLIRKLQAVVPPSVEVKLAGSLAKGTDLKGKNEFDIFILFPLHYSHHEMTMLGISYARRAFHGMKMESRYAEHPYLQVFSGDYHADIVPAYKIASISDKGSSVDRSQLHTAYVNSKLDSRGKDNVRLLKRFTKNFGIYGAELRVEGFSGYLCELLVIHHSGSLLKLMEEAAVWQEPALDTASHHKGEHKKNFPDAPLVVIDPVDPHRNVAAVVAQTSLSRFIFECRRFLTAPSEAFFFSKKQGRSTSEIFSAMKKRGTRLLLLSFPAPKVVPDVLWPQLKKTAHALSRRLSEQDFPPFGCYHWSDGRECAILFELGVWQLPSIRKVMGPSIRFPSDVNAFVEKHSTAFNMHLEHDRMAAVIRRDVCDAETALRKACKNTSGLGVPAHMQAPLSRARLLQGKDAVKEKYNEMLADYFFAKI